MEKEFTAIEKGTLTKDGREYDYIVEIAEDFPKKEAGNVRIRIIEERPAIRKIRTRYDPEIQIYGDKDASMDLLLGYDMNEINYSARLGPLMTWMLCPIGIAGMFILMINLHKLPGHFITGWAVYPAYILVAVLVFWLLKAYYTISMRIFAEYLKARGVKQILDREGFRQDE